MAAPERVIERVERFCQDPLVEPVGDCSRLQRGAQLGLVALISVGALLGTALAAAHWSPRANEEEAPFQPLIVAHLGGPTEDLAADARRVFLATGERVVAFDASVPGLPERRGESPAFGGTVHSVALYGDAVFVALGQAGLRALQVSDLSALYTLPVSAVVTGSVDAVRVSGDRLYVRDDTTRQIVVFGLTDLPDLRRLAALPAGHAAQWAVAGNLLIQAYFDDYGYVDVYDLSDLAGAKRTARVRLNGYPCGITAIRDHLLVAYDAVASDNPDDEHWRLADYDLTDPLDPRLRGEARSVPEWHIGCLDLANDGEHAVLLSGQGYTADMTLSVLENTATAPRPLSELPLHAVDHVVMGSGRAYLTDYMGGGLQVVSLATPAAPALIGTYDTPGRLMSISVSGDRVAFVDGGIGLTLHVASMTLPASPQLLAPADTMGTIAVMDGARNLAAGDRSLEAFEVRGERLTQVAQAALPDIVNDFASSGERVFVAFERAPMQVFDWHGQDLAPVVALPEVTGAVDVGLVGNALYAVTTSYYAPIPRSTLRLVSTEPIDAAAVVGRLEFDHETFGAATDGRRLYLASAHPVHVTSFDIDYPTNPVALGDVALPCCQAYVLAYSSGRLYATGDRSVVAIDVSDPARMRVLGEKKLYEPGSGRIDAIAAAAAPDGGGTLLYLATINDGLVILRDGPAPDARPSRLYLPVTALRH